jgi:hypothetical protein
MAAQAGRRVRDDPIVSGSIFRGELLGHPDESRWSVGIRQRQRTLRARLGHTQYREDRDEQNGGAPHQSATAAFGFGGAPSTCV